MSVVVTSAEGPLLISKGAPSEVLQQCRAAGDGERLRVQAAADAQAARGLRVLALAVRRLEPDWSTHDGASLERDLSLVALLGLYDPPRPEVPAAIAACRDAGIKVTMVTGDSGLTAQAIASQIGLLDQPAGSADHPAADPVRVIEGDALDHLSPVQLRLLLRHRRRLVFARMAPEQKLRLVEAYRSLGDVVAVTGDGVNDAPSLRAADVGIAMGRSGTDVAREAADIVLLDDNFATIVEAVRHGRAVVANIGRFLTYVLASNVAEMAPFVAMVTLQVPAALSVLQILAVDLGTDLLPALGLGAEPPEPGVMRQPPRRRNAPLLNLAVLVRAYLVLGLIEALVSMGGYLLALPHNQQQASTLTFVLIVAGQMGALLACRSSIRPFWQLLNRANPLFWVGLASEPLIAGLLVLVTPVAAVFGMEPLPRPWLGWIGLAPLAVLLGDTLHKQLNQTASAVSSRFNSANR
jgi:Ca2+-transporting ATPase